MDDTLKDAKVKPLLHAKFYYYSLDVGNFDKHRECLQRYQIRGIPYLAVFQPDGTMIDSVNGYEAPGDFLAFLQKQQLARNPRKSKITPGI